MNNGNWPKNANIAKDDKTAMIQKQEKKKASNAALR